MSGTSLKGNFIQFVNDVSVNMNIYISVCFLFQLDSRCGWILFWVRELSLQFIRPQTWWAHRNSSWRWEVNAARLISFDIKLNIRVMWHVCAARHRFRSQPIRGSFISTVSWTPACSRPCVISLTHYTLLISSPTAAFWLENCTTAAHSWWGKPMKAVFITEGGACSCSIGLLESVSNAEEKLCVSVF